MYKYLNIWDTKRNFQKTRDTHLDTQDPPRTWSSSLPLVLFSKTTVGLQCRVCGAYVTEHLVSFLSTNARREEEYSSLWSRVCCFWWKVWVWVNQSRHSKWPQNLPTYQQHVSARGTFFTCCEDRLKIAFEQDYMLASTTEISGMQVANCIEPTNTVVSTHRCCISWVQTRLVSATGLTWEFWSSRSNHQRQTFSALPFHWNVLRIPLCFRSSIQASRLLIANWKHESWQWRWR